MFSSCQVTRQRGGEVLACYLSEVIGELEELVDAAQALINTLRLSGTDDISVFRVGVRYLAWEFRGLVNRIDYLEKESDHGV